MDGGKECQRVRAFATPPRKIPTPRAGNAGAMGARVTAKSINQYEHEGSVRKSLGLTFFYMSFHDIIGRDYRGTIQSAE